MVWKMCCFLDKYATCIYSTISRLYLRVQTLEPSVHLIQEVWTLQPIKNIVTRGEHIDMHSLNRYSSIGTKLPKIFCNCPSKNYELWWLWKKGTWSSNVLLARYGFRVLSWIDWYDLRLQYMWNPATALKEARANVVEEPI